MAVVIYSTIDTAKAAQKIAHVLTKEKLAACVNILPEITSVYRWKDKIEKDTECVMIVKTTDDKVDQAVHRIRELHPYDIPDIIVLPIIGGLKAYLEYVKDETS